MSLCAKFQTPFNMKNIICFILFASFSITITAQNTSSLIGAYNQELQKERDAHNYKKAIELSIKIIKIEGKNPWNLGQLASNLFSYKDYSNTIKVCNERILMKDLSGWDKVITLYIRGWSYRELGHNYEALSDFNKGISIDPDFPDLYFTRADVNSKLNRLKEAKADYEKFIKQNPDEEGKKLGLVNLSDCELKLGQEEDALITLLLLTNAYPRFSRGFEKLGKFYHKFEQYHLAIDNYTHAIRLDATNGSLYNSRAKCKYIVGKRNSACEDWRISKGLGFHKAFQLSEKYCE